MNRKLLAGILAGGLAVFVTRRHEAASLNNKVVVITGASAGIGRETARAFAEQGAHVVLVARRAELLAQIQDELAHYDTTALAVPADVTCPDDLHRIVETTLRTFGRIDVLVNNAGLSMGGPLHEQDMAAVRRMIEVNLIGLIHLTQLALPVMLRQRSGHIVNVSSVAGVLLSPGQAAYAATKAAINGFTTALQREVRGTGVHVSVVLPGWIHTAMLDEMDIEEMRAAGMSGPLMPVDRVESVADAIVDAVRYNRKRVVMGGLKPRLGDIIGRTAPGFIDLWFAHVVKTSAIIKAMEKLGAH